VVSDQLALVRDVGRPGDELDRHYTPDACARRLVDWLIDEYHRGPGERPYLVVEPSVGAGAFARAVRPCLAPGGRIVGYDVDDGAPGRADVDEWRERSWLEAPEHELAGVDLVVGNPPFTGAVAIDHLRRALTCGAQVVALVLPWSPLGGVAAWDNYVDGPWRPVAAVPLCPSPWPASVRETALYVWLPTEPLPRRTEIVRIGRWR
jgi:hypothetical protein